VTWADPGRDLLRFLTAGQVDALSAGATLLGSGGGGDVALGVELLRHALHERPVRVVPAAHLPPGALVVHVGIVGGPDVLAERLIDPADLAVAARAVVGEVGGELAAVGVIEIGGLNAAVGVLAAAELGVPVVDGDLMGRAFPRIGQTALAVAGHAAAPMALVGPGGDVVVVPACSGGKGQALVAACASAMGGAAALALYPTTAEVLAAVGVRGSVSACVRLGRAFSTYAGPAHPGQAHPGQAHAGQAHAGQAQAGPAQARVGTAELVHGLGGRLVGEGRVDELRPRIGQAPGSLTLSDRESGSVVRVDHVDEFLAVAVDGAAVVRPPDVIVALDPSNRRPLRCDEVRLGQALAVFTLPPLHAWPASADPVVGPAGFGLELDWTTR
jgi:DUF917 family protein